MKFVTDEDGRIHKWISVRNLTKILSDLDPESMISARTLGNTGNLVVHEESGAQIGFIDLLTEELIRNYGERK